MVGLLLTYIWRFHDLTPLVTTLRVAAICTVSSWAFLLLQPRLSVLSSAVKKPYIFLFLLFSVWGAFTVPTALSPPVAWQSWFQGHFKTMTMILFILTCLRSFTIVRFAIMTQVVGGGVLALFYIKSGFPQAYTPVPMYDRNDFSLALNIALPMALFLALTERAVPKKRILWGTVLAIATSVMMSQSRGGFLTIAATTLFTVTMVRDLKWRHRLLPPILLVVGVLLLPAEVQDRLATLLNPSEDYNMSDEQGRVEIWKRGLGYLDEHKFMGVGWDNFPVAEGTISQTARMLGSARNTAVHNSFLQAAVETGIPGFILFLAMIFAAMVRLFLLRTRLDRIARRGVVREMVLCADFLLVSIVAYCIGGFFLSMAYTPMLYGQLALAAGLEMSAARWLRHVRATGREPAIP